MSFLIKTISTLSTICLPSKINITLYNIRTNFNMAPPLSHCLQSLEQTEFVLMHKIHKPWFPAAGTHGLEHLWRLLGLVLLLVETPGQSKFELSFSITLVEGESFVVEPAWSFWDETLVICFWRQESCKTGCWVSERPPFGATVGFVSFLASDSDLKEEKHKASPRQKDKRRNNNGRSVCKSNREWTISFHPLKKNLLYRISKNANRNKITKNRLVFLQIYFTNITSK